MKGLKLYPVVVVLGIPFLLMESVFWASAQKQPLEVAVRMILLRTSEEARQVLANLQRGEDFAELAKKRSIDSTGPEGGYLGKVKLSDLRPEIQEALKGLPAGQVSGVVQTPVGYMILKVLEEAERVGIESAQRAPERRPTTLVGGVGEVDHLFRRIQKPADWEQNLQTVCALKVTAVRSGLKELESYLAAAKSESAGQGDNARLMAAYQTLAQLWAYLGELDQATKYFQAAYEQAVARGDKQALLLELEEKLGIAHLRLAEVENLVPSARAKTCMFPMPGRVQPKQIANWEAAIRYFLKFLEQKPEDLEVRWLLNLAAMALGSYPDAVPKQYLIPLEPFESKEDVGRFVDVAPLVGADTFSTSGGAIVDDLDNDGLLDIVTTASYPCGPMHYLQNSGTGTFTDRTAQAGLADQLGGLNMVQADYNNDGCLDILVLRGAWDLPMRNSLLRNNCDGTFTDVTRPSGLAVPATSTQTAAWADIDLDGDLDLFVGNEHSPSQLFLNQGDGTFVDIAPAAGVDRVMFTKAVVAGDYDNDGYPDFYLSNQSAENFLYHNNRDLTFTDMAKPLRVQHPIFSFPVWFFDYDNDGWLDLFVSSHYVGASIVDVILSYLQLPVQVETLKLYRNTGSGFQDMTKSVRLDRVFKPMGVNFGDLDNDGFLDFYLGTGSPSYGALVPNVLFRNHDGKYFVDVTTSSGTGDLHKGHGVAFADIDNDGDEDIFIEMGGAVRGDRHGNLLFRNPGHGNNWISLRLVGVKTNRRAIGARIKLAVQTPEGGRRFIHRLVGSGGSFGSSPLEQHIGLGKAARIETLEIWWPASDTRQVFHNVGANQFLEIKESERTFTALERPSFSLGEISRTHPTRRETPLRPSRRVEQKPE